MIGSYCLRGWCDRLAAMTTHSDCWRILMCSYFVDRLVLLSMWQHCGTLGRESWLGGGGGQVGERRLVCVCVWGGGVKPGTYSGLIPILSMGLSEAA